MPSPSSGPASSSVSIKSSTTTSSALFLSKENGDDDITSTTGEEEENPIDSKTKVAMDLKKLFDIDEMAYNVMIREEQKGPDRKLTPQQLFDAIKKDIMFGEDFEEYYKNNESEVQVLEIGKFSKDFESSTPLPAEDQLTIKGKGNYLVHVSFTKEIFATMRVVVDWNRRWNEINPIIINTDLVRLEINITTIQCGIRTL